MWHIHIENRQKTFLNAGFVLRRANEQGYVSLAWMNSCAALSCSFAVTHLLVVAFLNKGQICANATLFPLLVKAKKKKNPIISSWKSRRVKQIGAWNGLLLFFRRLFLLFEFQRIMFILLKDKWRLSVVSKKSWSDLTFWIIQLKLGFSFVSIKE